MSYPVIIILAQGNCFSVCFTNRLFQVCIFLEEKVLSSVIKWKRTFRGDFFCVLSGDFKRDFAAISNRPCKLLAIPSDLNFLAFLGLEDFMKYYEL